MSKDKITILEIEDEAFDSLKADFNVALTSTIGRMQNYNSNKASISMKLNINLINVKMPDSETGEIKQAKNPIIDYKFKTTVKHEDEIAPNGLILEDDAFMVFKSDQKRFCIRKIDDGQMTIDDLKR